MALVVVAAVCLVGLTALGFISHAHLASIAHEDGMLEWATAYAWLAAGVLFARAAWKDKGAARLVCLLLALAAFFAAGEELSWGQRLFGFEPPELFLEENFQQELNLHNLFNRTRVFGISIGVRAQLAMGLILYGIVVPAGLSLWERRRGKDLSRFARWFPTRVHSPLVLAALAHALFYPYLYADEIAEFVFAFVVFSCALAVTAHTLARRALACCALFVVAGLTASGFARAARLGAQMDIAEASTEMRVLAADLQQPGAIRPNMLRATRVHKRLFNAVRSGYVNLDGSAFLDGDTPATSEAGRRDRKGYLLDPWRSAYWIRFDAVTRQLLLYSFGPDRVPGVRVERGRVTAQGDDLVISWRAARSR